MDKLNAKNAKLINLLETRIEKLKINAKNDVSSSKNSADGKIKRKKTTVASDDDGGMAGGGIGEPTGKGRGAGRGGRGRGGRGRGRGRGG